MKTATVRLHLALLLMTAALGGMGCSSSDSQGGAGSGGGTAGSGKGTTATGGTADGKDFKVVPETIYTGFDGTNKYKAPITAVASAKVTWSLSEPGAGELTPEEDGTNVTFVAKKAGTFSITATSGTAKITAKVIVTAYTPAQHDAGAKRYTSAESGDPPCASCHGGANGKDHTPTQLVFDKDDDVIATFVTGKDPEGEPVPAPKHTWAVTEAEKAGLVAYLRALEPKGFPSVDDAATKK